MSNRNAIRIGNAEVGNGGATFVVIELGVTHGNDEELAATMIREAKRAGADAVKCEVINPDRLVAADYRDRLEYSYVAYSGKKVVENYYNLIRQVTMPLEMLARLKRYADELQMPFFGTAFDFESVDFLKSIGSCAIKLASPEIVQFPLLDHAVRSGLPVLLDSGKATTVEIGAAVSRARLQDGAAVVVMHNPSGYPAADKDVHLRMIPTLQNAFDVPVGLSCHSRGSSVSFAAVGIGADVIEKPVTDDNTQDGDEHIFSLNIGEIAPFVATIRQLDLAKGMANRDPELALETDHQRNTYRQSLVAVRDMKAGNRITREDFRFARPGWGILAADGEKAIGRTIIRSIRADHTIHWQDLAPADAVPSNKVKP